MLGVSAICVAAPPQSFDDNTLKQVKTGKIVLSEITNTSTQYEFFLRGWINKSTPSAYVNLVTDTKNYKKVAPDLILDSSKSSAEKNDKYSYDLDIRVYYGAFPMTLYASVVRALTEERQLPRLSYVYTFQGYETTMEPLLENTQLFVDPADSGVYFEDRINIKIIFAMMTIIS